MSEEKRDLPETPVPETPASETKKKKKKKGGPGSDLYSWLQALVFAMVLLIVAFTFLGRIIGVYGQSMEPTLYQGDMLLLQCVGYEPEAGDVVVLRKAFGEIDSPIVKRVIALEGQTVEIDYSTATVYVDGTALDEPYILPHPDSPDMLLPSNEKEQGTYWVVPEGCVFVMGDNRNHSADSRNEGLGPVDTRYIIGKALFIIAPFSRMQAVG